MADLSNADIIRILRKFQNCGWHEYTCGVEACRAVLEPEERDGKVMLVCTTCGNWEQDAPCVTEATEIMVNARRLSLGIKDDL